MLKVAEHIKWREKSDRPNRAKGISCCIKDGGGTYKVAGATVKMSSDGSVVLLDRNGGTRPGSKDGIVPGSRRRAFHAHGTDHRRSTRYRCDAVRHLHQRQQFDGGDGHSQSSAPRRMLRKQLLQCAAKILKQKADDLRLHNGHVVLGERPALSFGNVIVDFFGSKAGEIIAKGLYKDKRSPKAVLGSTATFWEVGWGGVEVEVDPDTGVVRLLNYVSVCDTGKAINPEQCIGQDEGAVMFGIGHTLMEEMVYEDGQLLNGNFVDYRVPTFADLPGQVRHDSHRKWQWPGSVRL